MSHSHEPTKAESAQAAKELREAGFRAPAEHLTPAEKAEVEAHKKDLTPAENRDLAAKAWEKASTPAELRKNYGTACSTIAAELEAIVYAIDGEVIPTTSKRDSVRAKLQGLADRLKRASGDPTEFCS